MSWRKPRTGTAREQLDKRQQREADLRPAHVVGPGPGPGTWTIHDTHDSSRERFVSAGVIGRSLRPGEVVMIGSHTGNREEFVASTAPHGKRGAAQFGFSNPIGLQRDTVGVTAADPNTIEAGAEEIDTTFTGFGFREDPLDNFRPVVYNETTKTWDDDPYVTLGAVTWVSVSEVTIPVSVISTAPAGYEIRLEVLRA